MAEHPKTLCVLDESLQGSATPPVCPIFGECGGCQFQHLTYAAELAVKEKNLSQQIFHQFPDLDPETLDPIVPSPKFYGYRHVLDVKLLRMRNGKVLIGFSPLGRNRVIPAEACPIARPEISSFLPELRRQATARITARYRQANLVVKTGDEGRVLWGGIGRRSLQRLPAEYLWTEINGRRIFYSLDTFFQANLFILPDLISRIKSFNVLTRETVFYDLYGGVGLFSLSLADFVRRVILIESNTAATCVAEYNRQCHSLENFHIIRGRVEDRLFSFPEGEKAVVMVDPPRAGLSPGVIDFLCATPAPEAIIYLSCNPVTFIHDVEKMIDQGWRLKKVIPFDFFPRTSHLEVLGLLMREGDS